MSTKKMSAAASSAKASAANVQSMGDKRTTSVNTVHTQSKRKNIVHSDDSDVEIIETSTPAKKKCVYVSVSLFLCGSISFVTVWPSIVITRQCQLLDHLHIKTFPLFLFHAHH
ncbi:hypothetical protein BYT27DRAFT_6857507 [Phlegmacium glaucopus]|nr:hypothetical protein BYT27DRAFT_6857507 [Phlegmacium glaucopus]